jgi:hypothetical protein
MFFSLQVAMVSKTLSEIRPAKELWKIKARVTRKWDAILLGSGEQISIDMILIDNQVSCFFIMFIISLVYMLMIIKKSGYQNTWSYQ